MTLKCYVSLLDGSEASFEVGKNAKASTLIDEVCKHLNIVEKDYFGLIYKGSVLQKAWLSADKKIKKQVRKNAKIELELAVKFYPSDPTKLAEEITRYQVCLQIRKDLAGNLVCSADKLTHLLSYWLQSEYEGKSDNSKVVRDCLKDFEKPPEEASSAEFIDRVLALYRGNREMSSADADNQFLATAAGLRMYGVQFYKGKDATGNEIFIGIGAKGVTEKRDGQSSVFHSWSRIKNIVYKKNKFKLKLLRAPKDGDPRLKKSFLFESENQVQAIWKSAVDHHVFFRVGEKDKKSSDSTKKPKKKKSILRRLSSKKDKPKTETDVQEASKGISRRPPTVTRASSLRRSASLRMSTSSESSLSLQHSHGTSAPLRGGVTYSVSREPQMDSEASSEAESTKPDATTAPEKVTTSAIPSVPPVSPAADAPQVEQRAEEEHQDEREYKDEDLMEAVIGKLDGTASGGSSTLLLTETILEEDEENHHEALPSPRKRIHPVHFAPLRDEESRTHQIGEGAKPKDSRPLETDLDAEIVLSPVSRNKEDRQEFKLEPLKVEENMLHIERHKIRIEDHTEVTEEYTEVWEDIYVEPVHPPKKTVAFEQEKESVPEREEHEIPVSTEEPEPKTPSSSSSSAPTTEEGEIRFNTQGDEQMQHLPEDDILKVHSVPIPTFDDLHRSTSSPEEKVGGEEEEEQFVTTIKEYIPKIRRDSTEEETEEEDHGEFVIQSEKKTMKDEFDVPLESSENVDDFRLSEQDSDEEVETEAQIPILLPPSSLEEKRAMQDEFDIPVESSENVDDFRLSEQDSDEEIETEPKIPILPSLSSLEDKKTMQDKCDVSVESSENEDDFRLSEQDSDEEIETEPNIPALPLLSSRDEKTSLISVQTTEHLKEVRVETRKEEEDRTEREYQEYLDRKISEREGKQLENGDEKLQGQFDDERADRDIISKEEKDDPEKLFPGKRDSPPITAPKEVQYRPTTHSIDFRMGENYRLSAPSRSRKGEIHDYAASTTAATIGDDDDLAMEELDDEILYEEEHPGYKEGMDEYRRSEGEEERDQKESNPSPPGESVSRSTSLSDITDNTDELLEPNVLEKAWSQGAGLDEDDELFQILFRTPPRRRKHRNKSEINPREVRKGKQEVLAFRTTIDEEPVSPRRRGNLSKRPFIPSWPFDPMSLLDSRDLGELEREAIHAALDAQKELMDETKRLEDMEMMDDTEFSSPEDFDDESKVQETETNLGDSSTKAKASLSALSREKVTEFLGARSRSPSASPRMVGEEFIPGVPDFVHSVIPYQLKTPSDSGDSEQNARQASPVPVSKEAIDPEAMKFPHPIVKFAGPSRDTNSLTYRYSPPIASASLPNARCESSAEETEILKYTVPVVPENTKQPVTSSGRSTPSGAGNTSQSEGTTSSNSKSSSSSFPRFIHSVFPFRRSSSSDRRGRSKTRRKREKKITKQKNKKKPRSKSKEKTNTEKSVPAIEITSPADISGFRAFPILGSPPNYSELSQHVASSSSHQEHLPTPLPRTEWQSVSNGIEHSKSHYDVESLDKIVLSESDDAHSDSGSPDTVRRADGFSETSQEHTVETSNLQQQ